MAKTLDQLHAEYIALCATDVRQHPTHFKARVVSDPEGFAASLIEGLDALEVARWLRELRADLRSMTRAD